LDIIYLLISHDAKINAVDNDGRTPLIHSIRPGDDCSEPADDLVKLLIEKNADIEIKDKAGKSAIFFGKSLLFRMIVISIDK
jgi:ankyrin repeat protein